MTTRRMKILAVATAALLAIGVPLSAQSGDPAGVIVMEVVPESAAEAAGLQTGDRITAVGGRVLDGAAGQRPPGAMALLRPRQLVQIIAAGLQTGDFITVVGGRVLGGAAGQLVETIGDHAPGDEVSIAYDRDGKEMTAAVSLGEHPESGAAVMGIRYQPRPTIDDVRCVHQLFDDARERFAQRASASSSRISPFLVTEEMMFVDDKWLVDDVLERFARDAPVGRPRRCRQGHGRWDMDAAGVL